MEISLEEAVRRADEAYKNGNMREAEKFFSAIISVCENDEYSKYKLALVSYKLGKISKALCLLSALTKLNNSKLEIWLNYIEILLQLGLLSEANYTLILARKSGQSSTKLQLLKEKLKKEKQSKSNKKEAKDVTSIQRKYLLELYSEKKFEKILKVVAQLRLYSPKSIFLLNIMGVVNMDLRNYGKAVHFYQEVLKISPNSAEAHNNMGAVLQSQKKLDEALICYRKALQLQPMYVEATYNLGNAFLEVGMLNDAEEYFRQAIRIKPDYVDALINLGNTLQDIGNMQDAKNCYKKVVKLNPKHAEAFFNLHSTSNNILDAEKYLTKCLEIYPDHLKAKLTLALLEAFQGDSKRYNDLASSNMRTHHLMRSIKWYLSLGYYPDIFFNRWHFFSEVMKFTDKSRPFYEFGVWRGQAFKYFMKTFGKGYGFDTFEGLPEQWHSNRIGSYSGDGKLPDIEGGVFVKGKFEDTLPTYFSIKRPMASLINFDADLYSSTKCALNYSHAVMDDKTILVFDEFVNNKNWEADEYKALDEFCKKYKYDYTVLAISFFTKQVAIKIRKKLKT